MTAPSPPMSVHAAPDPPGHRRYQRPPNPWVAAVEPHNVQLVWRVDSAGRAQITARWPDGEAHHALDLPPGGGAVDVGGLPVDQPVTISLDHDAGARATVQVTTLRAPPGAETFRFATLSDLHLGSRHLGFLSTVVEDPAPAVADTVRLAHAALDDAVAWGAQLVVLKGDLTNRAQPDEWDALATLVARCPVPVIACCGNHDVSPHPGRVDGHGAVVELGLATGAAVETRDVPGARIIVADTTAPLVDPGRIRPVSAAVTSAASDAGGQVFVALHHQFQRTPVPTYWPPGIASGEADHFLAALGHAAPGALVTSGHTHRNRRRQAGPVVVTEVGSPRDFPGVWAGYVVHEGGLRQVVRRVSAPSLQARIDSTARAAFGQWCRWSAGALSDRCFVIERAIAS
ncbi:MAG: metallophosphoesterase family protein [Acidimicrobiia bacterium]|nr:metallophosphoesterase family protein [Acidimicrobiia bacterium]